MIIQSVALEAIDRAMTRAVGTSLGRTENTLGYIVRVVTRDGASGIGWAHENPYIAGETAQSIHSVISEVIAPFLVGKDAFDIAMLMEGIEKRVVFNYRAKAAVDMALHDLAARSAGWPLYRLLGGAMRESVTCVRMIGLDTPDEMANEASQLRGAGFAHFKLKIDGTPEDIDRVRAVADVLSPEGRLILDANQAYTPKQIIQFVDRLHDCDALAILEQPVPVDDIDGLALVRRSVNVLVEADESILTPGAARRVLDKQAADLISLKVPKMGGLYWTRKIADLCQIYGVPNLVGANVGSCIIDLVHTHLACSHPNVTAFAAEIGESQRLVHDIATGLVIENGQAMLPRGTGIGATLTTRDHA